MSLLGEVVGLLDAQRIPHALIGAAGMALHGMSRATADVDLIDGGHEGTRGGDVEGSRGRRSQRAAAER